MQPGGLPGEAIKICACRPQFKDFPVPTPGWTSTLAEKGVVHMHMGIQGVADLDAVIHGWMDPVVEIVIERTG
jgi:hypothetical protein